MASADLSSPSVASASSVAIAGWFKLAYHCLPLQLQDEGPSRHLPEGGAGEDLGKAADSGVVVLKSQGASDDPHSVILEVRRKRGRYASC